jgi:hypothetical protein
VTVGCMMASSRLPGPATVAIVAVAILVTFAQPVIQASPVN